MRHYTVRVFKRCPRISIRGSVHPSVHPSVTGGRWTSTFPISLGRNGSGGRDYGNADGALHNPIARVVISRLFPGESKTISKNISNMRKTIEQKTFQTLEKTIERSA